MTENWGGPSPYGRPSPYGQPAPHSQPGPYAQPSPYGGPQHSPYATRPYAPPATPSPAAPSPYGPPSAPARIPEQRGVDAAANDLWSDSPWDDDGDAEPAEPQEQQPAPRAHRAHHTQAVQEKRLPGAVPALVLIVVPLAAALASRGSGVVFVAGAVLGAFAAAALCTRRGVWWVATGTPPLVLLTAVAGFVVRDSSSSTGKFATNLAKVVAGAFPSMSAALGAAVVVGLVRLVSARRARKARR